MRSPLFPLLLIAGLMLALVCFLFIGFVHADPAIAILPNGQVTVIYPGTTTMPTIVIPPSGAPTYVYPGALPAPMAPAPISLPPMTPASVIP